MKDINDIEKWNAFCRELATKTEKGEIHWDDWGDRLTRPDAKSGMFVATYKQWRILVYKYDYKLYRDEDDFEWMENVAIEIIDEKGNLKWALPRVPASRWLLDQIQFGDAGVESLYNDLMGIH